MAKETSSSPTKSGTEILLCDNPDCISTYQDKLYGKHKRVHNLNKNGASCTVCGKKR